jgi:hypothetical protein
MFRPVQTGFFLSENIIFNFAAELSACIEKQTVTGCYIAVW